MTKLWPDGRPRFRDDGKTVKPPTWVDPHDALRSEIEAQQKIVKKDLMKGETKMLYVAPETLTKQENIDFLSELKISFVAVDEAHCILDQEHFR